MKKIIEVSQQKFDPETAKVTCVTTRYDIDEEGKIHVLHRQNDKDLSEGLLAPGNPDGIEVVFTNETTVGDLPL